MTGGAEAGKSGRSALGSSGGRGKYRDRAVDYGPAKAELVANFSKFVTEDFLRSKQAAIEELKRARPGVKII